MFLNLFSSKRCGKLLNWFLCSLVFFSIGAPKQGAFDSNFHQTVAEKRYAGRAIDSKNLSTKEASAPPSSPLPPAQTAVTKMKKLPGNAAIRLQKIDKILVGADRVLKKDSAASDEWRIRELESIASQTKNMMKKIQKDYGGRIPSGHPEIKRREDEIAAFESKVAELKEKIAAEKEAEAQKAENSKSSSKKR